jgi:hypothetical protein
MLQVFYIDVVKVDRDVAHIVMVIHVCFQYMFQMFHLFQMYVASVLSRCCKKLSGCCIYMHVAIICFKYFQVFHIYLYLIIIIKRQNFRQDFFSTYM